jgi:hypothetical protein
MTEEPDQGLARAEGEARREAEAQLHGHGLPAWIRAAAFLGVPALIAIFLVYSLVIGLVRRVTDIESTQQVQGRILDALVAEAAQGAQEARAQHALLERLMRQACASAAASPEARAACLAP